MPKYSDHLNSIFQAPLTRRAAIGLGIGAFATVTLASCAPSTNWLKSTGPEVGRVDAARTRTGRTTAVTLNAAPTVLDLAGATAATWAFGGVPGNVIRLGAGDTLKATVQNALPESTSVHWHGLALRNDMDGVPPLTQQPIAAGAQFNYEFIAPDPGTYWFHPHVGPQLDRGLYGALIVEDPHEPLKYDDEWVVILDDWLDGVTATPDDVLKQLSHGMGGMMGGMMGGASGMGGTGSEMYMRMGNMLMGTSSDLLGGDSGDVYYPYFLVNGKPADDPEVYTARPGAKIRIRVINAGGDTAFRFALGGHRMTVTHSDGFPVEPVEVDSVLIGMGERYDVIVTLADGVFPFIAEAVGKRDRAFALVRTGSGTAPSRDVQIAELSGSNVLSSKRLTAQADVNLTQAAANRTIRLALTGSMMMYDWAVDGKRFNMDAPLANAHSVREGERVRVEVTNTTQMWHPFHLHGHTFQLPKGGPRKDTAIVLPGETLAFDFDANNPGMWAAHCHNIYHAESGMMTVIGYEK